jgi:Domain of unknown function (DUF4184)
LPDLHNAAADRTHAADSVRGMPITIPAHQAAVVPLKLLSPRRFDGVALVVGSMAPDVAYATGGLGFEAPSHVWHALFWFNLPVTLVLAALVRRAAPYVAANLPVGVLGAVRHPLVVTAYSALLGAFSHLVWDTVTHPHVLFFGGELPGLVRWRAVEQISELVGSAVTLAAAVHIGRRRLLLAWHGPAPEVPPLPVLFWSVTGGAAVVLTAVALVLPGNDIGPNVIGVRLLGADALAMLAGAGAVSSWSRRRSRPSRTVCAAMGRR